jgi:uncharacterized protein (TIGR02594 family)
MEHWSVFDFIGYVTLWIAAIFLAIREATRTFHPENWLRKVFHFRWLSYLPVVCLIIGGTGFAARQWGFIRPDSSLGIVTRPLVGLPNDLGPHPWLEVAFEEFGQHRYGNNNNNPRILEYFKSVPDSESKSEKDDWASAFAEWSLNRVGISGPRNTIPRAWLDWGTVLSTGREGCIVILSFRGGDEHIGFLLAQDSTSVVVFGGNTVDAVAPRRYRKSDVLAYRWPNIEKPREN